MLGGAQAEGYMSAGQTGFGQIAAIANCKKLPKIHAKLLKESLIIECDFTRESRWSRSLQK
jgi:hypothetical protein